eukprot:PhM_4_TR13555/c0_g1_i1/m.104450
MKIAEVPPLHVSSPFPVSPQLPPRTSAVTDPANVRLINRKNFSQEFLRHTATAQEELNRAQNPFAALSNLLDAAQKRDPTKSIMDTTPHWTPFVVTQKVTVAKKNVISSKKIEEHISPLVEAAKTQSYRKSPTVPRYLQETESSRRFRSPHAAAVMPRDATPTHRRIVAEQEEYKSRAEVPRTRCAVSPVGRRSAGSTVSPLRRKHLTPQPVRRLFPGDKEVFVAMPDEVPQPPSRGEVWLEKKRQQELQSKGCTEGAESAINKTRARMRYEEKRVPDDYCAKPYIPPKPRKSVWTLRSTTPPLSPSRERSLEESARINKSLTIQRSDDLRESFALDTLKSFRFGDSLPTLEEDPTMAASGSQNTDPSPTRPDDNRLNALRAAFTRRGTISANHMAKHLGIELESDTSLRSHMMRRRRSTTMAANMPPEQPDAPQGSEAGTSDVASSAKTTPPRRMQIEELLRRLPPHSLIDNSSITTI